ncbi:hypothetical protein B0H34DRAFT_440662 [Crassisporium funariophilum]|nr:hypothetical protein B0H34DRAFT_440662 [Crassisporium funariophilum]
MSLRSRRRKCWRLAVVKQIGTGTWLLQCAQTWKDCHFVGLDIVPLHPNLQNVGSPDLASRITWVQHNFLDGLPFQNEEFDFVHIKRIALGVPEDKWDALFEEISRVMKPGGAFEMVEEDLFFPGKRADDDNDDDESIKDDDTSSLTRRNSVSSYRFRRGSVNGNHIMHDDDESEDGSPLTPTTNATLQHTSSRSSSPGRRGKDEGRKADVVIVEDEHRTFVDSAALLNASGNPPAASTSSVALVWPHSRSSARPALSVKTKEHHESGLGIAVPTVFGSSISLLGSMGYVVHQQDPGLDALVQRARSSTQTSNTSNGSGRGPATTSTSSHMQSPGASSDGHGGGVKKTKPSPFLLRSLTKAPNNNPRDHTLLEAIWNAMLASRFVNTSPLSLLTGYLEYHFKDVRTHPPLLYTFPPAAPKPEAEDSDDEKQGVSDSDPDLDEARDAIVPRPQRPRSMKSKKSTTSNAPFSDENGELTEEHRWLSMKALLKHSSPYVKIDGSRSYAYSPSNKASFPIPKTKDGKPGATRRASRLPNTTLHIDLRTLNLHLALRAKEVIACSESMWEWVQEYQEKATEEPKMARTRAGSLATSMFAGHPGDSSSSLDLTKNTILEMTRDDFDQILNNFEMDMQDQASVGHALKERFNWHTFPSEILKDRKLFNQACRKYDKWVLEQQRLKSSYHPYPQSASKHHHRSGNSFSNPSIIPPTPDTVTSHESVIARSISSPQPGSERVVVDEPGANVSPTLHRHDPAVHFAPLSSPTSHHSMQSMPTQRLSRAMRVFVGWKAPSS